jgi:beta-phosphoglucomutase
MKTEACIFDLDGVLVDTAKYHFLAWKRLADDLGIIFTENDNERLKGVSRMASLEIILTLGKIEKSKKEKEMLAAMKNEWYVDYINEMTEEEILPGAVDFIMALKKRNIKVAVGSASKNTPLILERAGLLNLFDAVADGNSVHKVKPDPEIFLTAASLLGVDPRSCVVFEDAVAGIEAARNAGMICVGIGNSELLAGAALVVKGLNEMNVERLITLALKQEYE